MGLDWHIRVNGEHHTLNSDPTKLPCNGMKFDNYLDGTTARMLADLDMSPFYPLFPYGYGAEAGNHIKDPTLNAQNMIVVAKIIAKKASCAEHLRIAAWLWSWAEQDEDEHEISLYISY